jgi:hypothetical protein
MSGKVPPSSRSKARGGAVRKSRLDGAAGFRGADAAARRFERFTGHDAEVFGSIEFPNLDGVAVAMIGECDGVLYTTVRDGKRERYIHEFEEKDKPLLCVTPDGRQLLLVGGNYRFTERGIVDKSWPGD